MKKKLFLITAVILLNLFANAQIKWGLYGGGSILKYKDFSTQISAGDIGTITFEPNFFKTLSYNSGFYLEFELKENLSLETGIFSGNKGFEQGELIISEYEGPLDSYGNPDWRFTQEAYYNFTYKMPYVGVPVVLNYYLVNKHFKFYVLFGHKFGWCFNSETSNFLLGSSGSGYGDIPYNVGTAPRELPDRDIIVGKDGAFRSFHYDVLSGGGIGLGRFYIVYNYSYGLLNNSRIDFLKFKSRAHNINLKIDLTKSEE